MYRIYVVEDDFTIAKQIKKQLEIWDFEVKCAKNFHSVIEEFIAYNPHIVLMDIMLPFFNGYHWCSEIRKISEVPIIFISSASDNMNFIMAINMGGDDFIAKPVELSVLTAKVQAMLRRTYDMGNKISVLEHNGAILNLDDSTVHYKNNKTELSKNEFRILLTLMENRNKIVSRDTLMTKIWETDCYIDENTLTVNVSRLRKKLEKIGLTEFIKTKVGVGYII